MGNDIETSSRCSFWVSSSRQNALNLHLFTFSYTSRLLKLGKLAEYFSTYYWFRCHYPLITYLSSTAVFTNMLITLCFTRTRIPALVINRNFSIVSTPCSWDEGKKNQVVHDIFPCLRPLKAGVVVSLLVAVICSGWSGTRASSQ